MSELEDILSATLPARFGLRHDGMSGSYVVIDNDSGEEVLEMNRKPAGWFLRDLGGQLPVLINGRSVEGHVNLNRDDVVQVAGWNWTVPHICASRTDGGGVGITLRKAAYSISNRFGADTSLISDANVDIQAGEFVGILGPSGAGKSTLLHLMNHDYRATTGEVLFDGSQPEQFLSLNKGRLAYLPQEPVLHDSLTPRQALWYSAKLRGIAQNKDAVAATSRVLNEVGVAHRGDTPIYKLSGGEKKRVALAAELLGEPLALFLDEATSGLDPLLEKEMMGLFRQLADSGKTIVCITHYPDNVIACDRLIIVAQGHVIFEGTPDAVLAHFQVKQVSDIYQHLKSDIDLLSSTMVVPRITTAVTSPTILPSFQAVTSVEPVAPNVMFQIRLLALRYLHLLLIDFKGVFLLLVQAPIIALLIGATFGDIAVAYSEQHAADWKQVGFLLIMAILWCASTNAVREIVKERSIYRHEQRYGLIPTAYLISKFIPLSVIGVIQSCLLLFILGRITHLAGDWISDSIILSFVAFAATSIGLCISAGVKTSERAMTLLPVVLIGQAVFSGGLARLTGFTRLVAGAVVPAFWGLNGLKATLGSNLVEATFVSSPGVYQAPILGRSTPLWVDALALCLQCVSLLSLTVFFLKKTTSSPK